MANLADLVAARNKLNQQSLVDLKRVLIYGQPKSGKTFLAATVAQVPTIKRIYWFDLENGSSTLINPELNLTLEQMQKITVYNIPDTKDYPIAIDTMLKVISNRKGVTICEAHGKVNCVECKPKLVIGGNGKPESSGSLSDTFPPINDLGTEDCIVIDSLSQLGDSAFEVACRATAGDRNSYAKYGEQGRLLSDFLGMVQQLKTNVICITHVTTNEAEDTKKETVIPLCGTRNFSLKLSKYFSTVVYLSVEMKKFRAGSSPVYKINTVAGDRLGVKLEDATEPTMTDLFKGSKT